MRLLAHVPERWRLRLDSNGLWWFLYGLALSATIVALFLVNGRASHALARQAASQQAQRSRIRDMADANYHACIRSIPLARQFATHVAGVKEGFETLVENSEQVLAATPYTDPQYLVRVDNLARLEKASLKVSAFRAFPVPSVKSCAAARARTLGRR